MNSRLAFLALATLVALPAAAQPHTPPASLSQDEMHGLMMGQGMGLARAAEMQAFPGPKHVLELADSLALSDAQHQTAERLMAEVQAEARMLGPRIVEAERRLSALFDGDAVDDAALETAAHEAARLRAELRLVHLRAHVAMREALTAEQSARYHALRHGPDAPAHEPGSPHHPGAHHAADAPTPPAPMSPASSDALTTTLPSFDDARFTTAPLHQGGGYRLVGFAFRRGQALRTHTAPVDAYLLVVEGHARITVGDRTFDLRSGEGVALPADVPHAVEALDDARAILAR